MEHASNIIGFFPATLALPLLLWLGAAIALLLAVALIDRQRRERLALHAFLYYLAARERVRGWRRAEAAGRRAIRREFMRPRARERDEHEFLAE